MGREWGEEREIGPSGKPYYMADGTSEPSAATTVAASEHSVLELFAGVGGLHYALRRAGVPHRVRCAFDVDDSALRVYRHNHCDTPTSGADIVSLSVTQLEAFAADTWLLSPPCQPFTRQGHMLGAADGRTSALLHIVSLLRDAPDGVLPAYLLLENVVGFESSSARAALLSTLLSRSYHTRELWVSPSDVGIPNQRTRYFLLARRHSDFEPPPADLARLLLDPTQLDAACAEGGTPLPPPGGAVEEALQATCRPLASYLEEEEQEEEQEEEEAATEAAAEAAAAEVAAAAAAGGTAGGTSTRKPDKAARVAAAAAAMAAAGGGGRQAGLRVPAHVLERYCAAMDVVGPHARRSCCFTKNYTRYFKGAGSVLLPLLPSGAARTLTPTLTPNLIRGA